MVEALLILSGFLLVLLLLLGLFAYQNYVHGIPKNPALEKKGSSRLLHMWMLEFAYWLLAPLVKGLVWCRIHPNTISWASVFFAGFAAVAISKGYFGYGTILSIFAFLLDAVDGMVARMANMQSGAGAVLDSTLDRYTEFLFFMGLVYYYRFEPIALGLVLAALCGSWMVSYSSAKAEAIRVEVPRGTMRRPERLVILIVGTALAPIVTPLIEGNNPFPYHFSVLLSVAFVAIFSNATAIYRVYCLYRRLSERANEALMFSRKTGFAKFRRATAYSAVPTAVDIATLVFLVRVGGFHPVVATAVAVSLGTFTGYLIRRWVLKQRDVERREFLQELVVASTNVVWNVLLVYGLTSWLELNYLISRLIAALSVALVWNWPLNFRYMFPSEAPTPVGFKPSEEPT